jgi:uncharacterized protein YjiS (DUF1127 family)
MEAVMNQSERIPYPLAHALSAALAAAWAKVRDAYLAWFEARSRAIAIRELHHLSDRTLRDIGLERSDLYDAVHRGRRPW